MSPHASLSNVHSPGTSFTHLRMPFSGSDTTAPPSSVDALSASLSDSPTGLNFVVDLYSYPLHQTSRSDLPLALLVSCQNPIVLHSKHYWHLLSALFPG